MAVPDVFYDSDSGYLGGAEMHPERWRWHGNEAQIVDMGPNGPMQPATHDYNVNSCKKKKKWPDAPGFVGPDDSKEEDGGCLSGAFDGSTSNK